MKPDCPNCQTGICYHIHDSKIIDEQERIINIFHEASGHNAKTHYEGSICWFCSAVEKISGNQEEAS